MHVVADSLDDLLRKVYTKLLRSTHYVEPTKGGNLEEFGSLLTLNNPRARLSRTETKGHVFSCLGEFFWYMAGSNRLDFIQYYLNRYDKFSDDGVTIFGAYGPRLFNMGGIDQIQYVLEKLRASPASRKAVVQLFDANDVVDEHKDVPCTCTLQFAARGNRLHLHVNMRSNDAYKGLPHDVFSFTMLQELIARSLEMELGKYHHTVGSLHLYTPDTPRAEQFIGEGLQENRPMPSMPKGDPWPALITVRDLEEKIRLSDPHFTIPDDLPPYWQDIVRLLQIFATHSAKEKIVLKNSMSSKIYENYIRRRQPRKAPEEQLPLPNFSTGGLDARTIS